jgi:hypothetical protein
MINFKRFSLPSIFVSLLLAFSASAAEGQFCGYVRWDYCILDGHWMDTSDPLWDNLHFDCRLCVDPPCHSPCGEEEDEDRDAVYAAGAEGDRDKLLELAARGSPWIVFNKERRAFEILGCFRTTIVGHLPLLGDHSKQATSLAESGVLQTTEAWRPSVATEDEESPRHQDQHAISSHGRQK